MRKLVLSFLVALAVVIVPQAVSAHIRLDPSAAVVGRQTYSLRVPTEKDVPTVSVRLEVPKNVEVTSILPTAGWQYTTKTEPVEGTAAGGHGDSSTRITEITWSGGEIKSGEYMLFGFATNYTGDSGTISWKAYQTYADGSVVAWDDSNDEAPAPSVTITKTTKIDELAAQVSALRKEQAGNNSASSALWIAVVSALIATGAFLVTVKRSSKDTRAER